MRPTVNDYAHTAPADPEAQFRLTESELKALIMRLLREALNSDDLSKPLPNEHAGRQHAPTDGKIVGSKEVSAGIRFIFMVGSDGKSKVQSVRFDAARFTPAAAKKWLSEHGYSTALFEPAVAKYAGDETGLCVQCQQAYPEDELEDGLCADCQGELEKAEFTAAPWASPESELSAEDFCRVCLIDTNTGPKVKSNCHLPIRSRPGAPVNQAALRNAKARLNQVLGISAEQKAHVLSTLNRLLTQSGAEVGAEVEKTAWDVEAEIIKADDEKHLVYGIVYSPGIQAGKVDKSVIDRQNDVASAAEIERFAHAFLANSGYNDLQHKELLAKDKACVVESYIAPMAFEAEFNGKVTQVKKGAWVVVTYVPDDTIWAMVKSGELGGYSLKGSGKRRPVALQ